MPQEQINRAIDQFRKRLKKAIQVSGNILSSIFDKRYTEI